jgi:hypothetical protein
VIRDFHEPNNTASQLGRLKCVSSILSLLLRRWTLKNIVALLKNAVKLFVVSAVMIIRPLLTAGCSRKVSTVRMSQNNYDTK